MEIMSRVNTHAGQSCNVCLSTHGRLPETLRYYAHKSLQHEGSGRVADKAQGKVECFIRHETTP